MLAPLHNHVLVPPKGNTACAVSCYLLYTGCMNALHGDHRIIWMPPKMHPVASGDFPGAVSCLLYTADAVVVYFKIIIYNRIAP